MPNQKSIAVQLYRGPTDPICTRVSIGGNDKTGFYCVIRGELDASIEAVAVCFTALRAAKTQGVKIPTDRRFEELGGS